MLIKFWRYVFHLLPTKDSSRQFIMKESKSLSFSLLLQNAELFWILLVINGILGNKPKKYNTARFYCCLVDWYTSVDLFCERETLEWSQSSILILVPIRVQNTIQQNYLLIFKTFYEAMKLCMSLPFLKVEFRQNCKKWRHTWLCVLWKWADKNLFRSRAQRAEQYQVIRITSTNYQFSDSNNTIEF